MRIELWLVTALAACGSDPTQLQLVVPGQPAYFMAQIGDHPWRALAGAYDGVNSTYDVSIDGDFELAMVCVDTTFHAGELFGTVDDAIVTIGSWRAPCVAPSPVMATGPKLRVVGRLDQQGFVNIGSLQVIVNDPTLPFVFELPAGTYDVAYTSFNYVVGISHARVVSGPTDLGTLSFAAAAPMLTNDYEFQTIQGETADGETQVITRNNTVVKFNYPPSRAVFVAGAQLSYGDRQSFFVSTGPRSASVIDFDSVPSQFELLAPLHPFAWDRSQRSIQWAPTGDFYTTASVEFADATGSEAVTASKLWLDARDPAVLAVDESGPPDYRWTIGTGLEATQDVERWSTKLVLDSQTGQSFQPVR